jgi:hypothetical protein
MNNLDQITALASKPGIEPGIYAFIVSRHHIKELIFHMLLEHPDLPKFARIRDNRVWNGVVLSKDTQIRIYCLADIPEKLVGMELRDYYVSEEVKRMAYDDPHIFVKLSWVATRIRGKYAKE